MQETLHRAFCISAGFAPTSFFFFMRFTLGESNGSVYKAAVCAHSLLTLGDGVMRHLKHKGEKKGEKTRIALFEFSRLPSPFSLFCSSLLLHLFSSSYLFFFCCCCFLPSTSRNQKAPGGTSTPLLLVSLSTKRERKKRRANKPACNVNTPVFSSSSTFFFSYYPLYTAGERRYSILLLPIR